MFRSRNGERFTSNSETPRFESKVAPIASWCVCCWSVCKHDHAADQHAHLDCGRDNGPAARVHRVKRAGADETGTESVLRACVCVSWAAGRSDQSSLVRWRRVVLVCEATGTWTFCLAAGRERYGFGDASATIDAAGRHRLAAT